MLIRLPVGEDSQEFVSKLGEIFPHLEEKTVMFLYNKYRSGNILQILYELPTMYEVAFMTLDALGQQSWQFTANFINSIPNLSMLSKDEYDEYMIMSTSGAMVSDKEPSNISVNEIDTIFKKIAKDGYDSLENDEKIFLKTAKRYI